MSQPTSPAGEPPSCGTQPDPALPTVTELGKGDPAPRAQRLPGIFIGGIGFQILVVFVVVALIVLVLIVPGCQHRA